MPEISTKPYMLRAIYEWCTDSAYTPYLAVRVDAATRVPMDYVKKGEIVLNISFGATSGLKIDNDSVRFHARFNGISREIFVPIDNVIAIYASENGQGMAFEAKSASTTGPVASAEPITTAPALASVPSKQTEPGVASETDSPNDNFPKKGGRPTLTRIK